ncbi:hypothetical protein CPB85DRAFT_1351523 [Mucidula mucida]|nr:hypothetical protein CPB85DRAFT_1351523 [Mucidula mucida]
MPVGNPTKPEPLSVLSSVALRLVCSLHPGSRCLSLGGGRRPELCAPLGILSRGFVVEASIRRPSMILRIRRAARTSFLCSFILGGTGMRGRVLVIARCRREERETRSLFGTCLMKHTLRILVGCENNSTAECFKVPGRNSVYDRDFPKLVVTWRVYSSSQVRCPQRFVPCESASV